MIYYIKQTKKKTKIDFLYCNTKSSKNQLHGGKMFENWNRLVQDVKNGKFKVKEVKQTQEDKKEENEEKEN